MAYALMRPISYPAIMPAATSVAAWASSSVIFSIVAMASCSSSSLVTFCTPFIDCAMIIYCYVNIVNIIC